MATLTTGRTELPCKGIGGIKIIYFFPYVSYAYTQIVGTRGQEVTSFPATDIYGYEVSNAIFLESADNNAQGVKYSQVLTFELKKQDRLSTYDLTLMEKRDLRFIVKLNDGRYRIGGLFNGARLKFETDSGGDKEAFNGYRVEVKATEEWQAAFIDDLDSAGFTINYVLLLEDSDEIYTEVVENIILE